MNLDMIGQLLGDTRKEFGGPVPAAKEFTGQIPTPEGVHPGTAGLLDPKKVVNALGDFGAVAPLLNASPAMGLLSGKTLQAHPLMGTAAGLLGKLR